ncbi:hypothetical protein Tco_0849867 [Tanacetum coccineum]
MDPNNEMPEFYEYYSQLDMNQYTQYCGYLEQLEDMEEDEAESSEKRSRRYIARERELAEESYAVIILGMKTRHPCIRKNTFVEAKLLKQIDIPNGGEGCVMSTQEYIKKVVEDVGKDEDFKSGSWVSATDYVNANGGIVSGCLGDIKNFSQYGNLQVWCGWEWNVNGRRRNSEIDGRRRMADLELQVCENVTDQEMADEEALNHALEKEARQAWTEHKWLEKCGQFLMLNANANAHVNVYLSAALSSIHCAGLRMTNSKNQRLIAELKALGEQDVWRDSYVADMEENE